MLNSKQYKIEFGLSMLVYTVAVFFSVYFLNTYPQSSWVIFVAVLPVVPAIFSTMAVIRALAQLDELQQKIQLLSFAISFAVIGLATFSYGFLQNAGFPAIPYIWIFPAMIATWGIATPLVARRFQ